MKNFLWTLDESLAAIRFLYEVRLLYPARDVAWVPSKSLFGDGGQLYDHVHIIPIPVVKSPDDGVNLESAIMRAIRSVGSGRFGYNVSPYTDGSLYVTPPDHPLTTPDKEIALEARDEFFQQPVKQLLSWYYKFVENKNYHTFSVYQGISPAQRRAIWQNGDVLQRQMFARHLLTLDARFVIDMAHDPVVPWKGMVQYHGSNYTALQLISHARSPTHNDVRVGDYVKIGNNEEQEEEEEKEKEDGDYGHVLSLSGDGRARVLFPNGDDEGDVLLVELSVVFRVGDTVQHRTIRGCGGVVVGHDMHPNIPMTMALRVKDPSEPKKESFVCLFSDILVTRFVDGATAAEATKTCALNWENERSVFTTPYLDKAEHYATWVDGHVHLYRLKTDGKQLRMLDMRNDTYATPCDLLLKLAGIEPDHDRRETAKSLHQLFADCTDLDGAILNQDVEWVWFHPEAHLEWVSKHCPDGEHRAKFEITPDRLDTLLDTHQPPDDDDSQQRRINVLHRPNLSENQYVVPSDGASISLDEYRVYRMDHAKLWSFFLRPDQEHRDGDSLLEATHMGKQQHTQPFGSPYTQLLKVLREYDGAACCAPPSKKRRAESSETKQAVRPLLFLVRLPSGVVQLVPPITF